MINTQELDKMTKPQLIELATELGLTFDATQPKAVIYDLIAEHLKNESHEEAESEETIDEAPTEEAPTSEHNDETVNNAPTAESESQENSALKTAMAIELAKRSIRTSRKSNNGIKEAFQDELARRSARYGGTYTKPTDISTALNNEVARRQMKSKGRK